MKIKRYLATGILTAALAVGSVRATTITNSYTNSFPNGGATSDFSGGGTSVASFLYWYGPGYNNTPVLGDPTNDAAGDPTSGSLDLNLPFTTTFSQNVQVFGTFDNQYGYDGTTVMPLNIITNIGFDIYVDPATMPDSSGNYGSILMSLIDAGWSDGGRTSAWTNYLTIPAAAKGHWVHLNDTGVAAESLAMQGLGFTTVAGFGFYFNNFGDNGYPAVNQHMWIDNVIVQTSSAPPPPPPPPTLAAPVQAVPGLNVIANSGGVNDRQEVEFVPDTGLGWVGHTGSGPVTYSFTITSFPKAPLYTTEAYLFLIPNPAAKESAPDYNEAAAAWLEVQATPNGGQGIFQYKVNEPGGNNMLYGNATAGYTNAPGSWDGVSTLTSNGTNVWKETGNLTNVQSTKLLGTWTLKFTSDQNGTIIAPDGSTASFTIPSYYYTNFTETSGFNLYLGMQANTSVAFNQGVVYSGASFQGMPSAYSETFTGETTLNTNFWVATYTTGVGGTLIVPPTAPYWVSWSQPAIGYSLINSGSLGASAVWKNVSTYSQTLGAGTNFQLIASADLLNPNMDYFRLVKRSFSQMLVLVPGETFTPGVAPGYSGSPTALSLGGNSFVQEVVTVQAVDSQFNPISGVLDTVAIIDGTGSDPGEILPTSQAMASGSTTFGNSNPFFFADQGTWTITVTNMSNTNIPNAVSASVTVGP